MASPTLHCPHRPPCSACPRFGASGIADDASTQLHELARGHGLPAVPVVNGGQSGFRHRARLAIRGRLGSPKIGLFELGSHRVVHVPSCVVHHALVNRVAHEVRRALVDAGITCYSDAAHLGLARYLQVVIERESQTAQVVLVANSRETAPLAVALDLIRERLGRDLHSLWFNSNCSRSNVILGADFHCWQGPESVTERFGGARIHYPPGAFGQSNLEIAARIIEHLREHVPSGARVAEFYAGVGAIGLSLLGGIAELRVNEAGPQSLRGLELGLSELEPAQRAKVTVLSGSAGDSPGAAAGADVVIVDPPRKGLDGALTEHLGTLPPERLLYVSCEIQSLLRDAARLRASGRLALTSLTAFNLLPFTEHVETVAIFERR